MLSVQNDGRVLFTLAAFLLLSSPFSSFSQTGKNTPAPASHADAALEKRAVAAGFASSVGKEAVKKRLEALFKSSAKPMMSTKRFVPDKPYLVVTDVETREQLCDLSADGMEFVVAHGGRGGRGNARFATSTHQAPRFCEPGEEGEQRKIFLELKTIADVGLVGYPNAGKSTLLRAISAARPKVAPYPFTTLHPVVGIVEFPDYGRLTVADIPGLIDGAHANVGLGHEFLKHIERTSVLAYVLDMAGVDGREPWADYRHLQQELELYMKGLSQRPAVIVANKMDLPESAEKLELLREELACEPVEIIPVAAAAGELDGLLERLRERVERAQRPPFDF